MDRVSLKDPARPIFLCFKKNLLTEQVDRIFCEHDVVSRIFLFVCFDCL